MYRFRYGRDTQEGIVKTLTRPTSVVPPPDEEGAWQIDAEDHVGEDE